MVCVAKACVMEAQLSYTENAEGCEAAGSDETKNPMSLTGILAVTDHRKPQKTRAANPRRKLIPKGSSDKGVHHLTRFRWNFGA